MKVSFQRTIGILAYIVISSHFDDYPYEKQLSTSKPWHVLITFDWYGHPKKIHQNNISSTFLRSSFSTFSTF